MTGQKEGRREVHTSLRDESVGLDGSEEKRPLLPFLFSFFLKVLLLWYKRYFLSIG